MDQPAVGTFIRQYCLTEKLSEDGFGQAWRAAHQVTGTEVTIRLLAAERVAGDAAGKLKGLSLLRHPNLLSPLEVAVDVAWPHIVYDAVEGTALSEFLEDGAIPWANAAEVVRQLLVALAYLHRKRVVYGALLPSAVFVTEDSEVVLGYAGVQMAIAPTVYGSEITAHSDIASAGALLWWLVTGSEPEAGQGPRGPAPGVPGALGEFVARCRAEAGFGSASEAAEALNSLVENEWAPSEAEGGEEAAAPTPAVAAGVEREPEEAREPVGLETRILELRERVAAPDATPELRRELDGLLEAHGRGELYPLAGLKGRGSLRKRDVGASVARLAWGVAPAAGLGTVWWVLHLWLNTVPMAPFMRSALDFGILALCVVLSAWVGVALGMARVWKACFAVVSETGIVCHDERRSQAMVAEIAAREVRAARLTAAPNGAISQGTVDIQTWSKLRYVLRFGPRVEER